MDKIMSKTRIITALAISTFLVTSTAIADVQDIAQTAESEKTEKTMPSEASQSPISDQAAQTQTMAQSESTSKPAIPDHLPSVFLKAVPLSSNIDIATDFTPGIAGLIINIANAANSVRQATSKKIKVFYFEDGNSLFQGRTCIYRAVEIDDSEVMSMLTAGDLINVTHVSSQWNIDQVKEGEQPQKMDASHICYEKFQNLAAKSK